MNDPLQIILASASPRRLTLLREAGIKVRVIPPGVDEQHRAFETPEAYVQRNAREKAAWVRERFPAGGLVLAADTVVVLDGAILEKPKDVAEARAMLRGLSGRWHTVLTGVCIQGKSEQVFVEATRVKFVAVGAEEIDAYIATGEPMDKAGAYAIQGGAGKMIERIEGSYSNVVGLPVERVLEELDKCGLPNRGTGVPPASENEV